MTDEAYRQLQEEKCRAKHRFRSAQIAKAAARYQQDRSGREIFYYKCAVCKGGWHLTSTDPKVRELRAFERALHQAVCAGLLTNAERDHAIRQFRLT